MLHKSFDRNTPANREHYLNTKLVKFCITIRATKREVWLFRSRVLDIVCSC